MDNRYIGYMIDNKKVAFIANGQLYIKKIKKDKYINSRSYVLSESVNIVCNNLDSNYVHVTSKTIPYFSKIFISCFIFFNLVLFIFFSFNITHLKNPATFFIPFALFTFFEVSFIIVSTFKNRKMSFKDFNESTKGSVINYSILREKRNDRLKLDYYIMYRYRDNTGNIIHSVMSVYTADMLYKYFPINKSLDIMYNYDNSCESCVKEEYDAVMNEQKFPAHVSYRISAYGVVTNIVTKCIDDSLDYRLKELMLVDFIECEYSVDHIIYRKTSEFSVEHDRFKVGDKIQVFYDKENPSNYYCYTKTL